MMLKEQDVVHAKARITEFNDSYYEALRDFQVAQSKQALLKVQRCANQYFNYCEEFVGNSSLLGAHKDPLWAQGFAEDCLAVLNLMPSHYKLLKVEFGKLEADFDIFPQSTAYANMQRLVKKYIDQKITIDLYENFSLSGLPVYGFENEERQFMSRNLQLFLSFGFGVTFVILLLVTAFITPNPSSYQYTVFRIVLALAGGGVVAVFPGFIEVKFGNWLRAGGSLAVFAVIYFVSPAALESQSPIEPKNPPYSITSEQKQ
ncbi:hypothetical protein AB6C98_06895 [Vibrio splendidus]